MAEYEERAGLRRPHGSAALWTFYHTIDSQAVSPEQAARMAEHLARTAVRIPVSGPSVPDGAWVLPTSNWKPYEWSLNNVVPSENAHTALALWQAGRPDLAWPLWQGTMLDAMVLGQSPGNIPNLSHYDVHRRETYRDFADPIGSFSRALVEGLFGVRPDGLGGVLRLAPGLPSTWANAALRTPDFSWRFHRTESADRWTWSGTLPGTRTVALRLPTRGPSDAVRVNGATMDDFESETDAFGQAWVSLTVPAQANIAVELLWSGRASPPPAAVVAGPATAPEPASVAPIPPGLAWEPLALDALFNDQVDAIFSHEYLTPRSPHVSLSLPKQGVGSWSDFKASPELDDRGVRTAAAASGQGRLTVPAGGSFATPTEPEAANVAFVSWWDNFPRELSTPLHGRARHLLVLVAGSTSPMHSRIDNGEIEVTYADGTRAVLPLHNPTTWWPIERDYVIDDFAFRHGSPVPWRLELATGRFYQPDGHGGHPQGGAATVLTLPLDPTKTLQSLTVRALSTEVVIGLMAASLAR